MNKQDFLKCLKRKLKGLKKEECKKYIEYYDEMISDIVESGVSEEEAIARQGSIEQIVEEIFANINPTSLKRTDWRGLVLAVVSVILLLCCVISFCLPTQFHMSWNMNSSVGIIGGADGPTSIFLAGKIGQPWGLYAATAIVIGVTGIYFIKKYRKR